MTTTELLARLETAQEVLGFLMAVCAERIYMESKKARPDASKIAGWEAERSTFFDIEDKLRLDDQDGIERVIATYGPVAREIYSSYGTE